MIFPSAFDITTLTSRSDLLFQGAASELSSNTVRIIGDINGDGIDDIAIGAAKATVGNMQNAGQVYVVFGTKSTFSAQVLPYQITGKTGFIINGLAEGDGLGFSVSGAGDINGDGVGDLIVGANNAANGAGRAYVIFGQIVKYDGDFPSPFNLNELNGGNGFAINGIRAGDKLGFSAASLGDISGDKISDIIIGATGALDKAGSAYVIFGNTTSLHRPLKLFPHPFDLTSLNGNNGFVVKGLESEDELGSSVSSAGDVNNDGKPDILIGAYSASVDNLLMAGKAYAIFGADSYPYLFDLSILNGSNGFVVNGIADIGYLGCSVSKAGDVNGDGKDDIILGAYNAGYNGLENVGQAYVIFGNKTFAGSFDLNSLNGSNGFVIASSTSEPQAYLGYSVSDAGDINKDNKADILIGAYGANSRAGRVYVIFGQSNKALNYFDLSNVNGTNGFIIDGTYSGLNLGNSLAGGGDINGDAIPDIAIGSARNPSIISDTFILITQKPTNSIEPANVTTSSHLPYPKEIFIPTDAPKAPAADQNHSGPSENTTNTIPAYNHTPAPSPSDKHVGSADIKQSQMSSLDASIISGSVLTGLALIAGAVGAAIYIKSGKLPWRSSNDYHALDAQGEALGHEMIPVGVGADASLLGNAHD